VFAVAHVLGLLLAAFAATCLAPLICSLLYGDGLALTFLLTAAITALAGLLLAGLTLRSRRELKPRDGFLLITLSWLILPAAAALPLALSLPALSFTGAYFEAMSGLTTTGSTVITGLDALAPSLNFWRHLLQWIGGLGIIVMALAVMPLLGIGGMQLYKGQAPGVKEERLAPRIRETAKNLSTVYALLTAAAIVSLKVCGMSWFDAVCHAFSVVGLGGFSTHDASIAWFNSAAIEAVLTILMVVASLNFARHFTALRQLSLEPYKKDPECRAIFLVLIVSVVGIAALLQWHGEFASFGADLRASAFNVVSQASTTGFTTQDYLSWPVFAPYWMLFLSCIATSTGSTGGGIKMFRALLLARQTGRELKLLIHPSAMAPVRIGGRTVPDSVGYGVLALIFLYLVTALVLIFLLLLTGLDFPSSFQLVVASVNNTAHGLSSPGAVHNLHALTPVQTWVCTAAMLLGRLEIFSVVVLLRPAYWRK
jgi:trk system potassium uptake protein TrkH